MSSRIFKPWLVLVLIFVAGAATGVCLTLALHAHFAHRPDMQMMKRHWMDDLSGRLNLTADQQAKIDPIVTDATNQLQKLHHDEMAQAGQIMKSVNGQISAILTPDQQTKLQQLETERQKDFGGHHHP